MMKLLQLWHTFLWENYKRTKYCINNQKMTQFQPLVKYANKPKDMPKYSTILFPTDCQNHRIAAKWNNKWIIFWPGITLTKISYEVEHKMDPFTKWLTHLTFFLQMGHFEVCMHLKSRATSILDPKRLLGKYCGWFI